MKFIIFKFIYICIKLLNNKNNKIKINMSKLNLEMDFPVTNNFIKLFNKVACSWGQKKSPYDSDGQIRGNFIIKLRKYCSSLVKSK